MNTFIKVTYDLFTTGYSIRKALESLDDKDIISYDCEVQSMYSIEERAEAKELVKKHLDEMSTEDKRFTKLVARTSGLSNPRLVKVTHFIFGLSDSHSIILISTNPRTEQLIMDWIVSFKGKLIIHNTLFDLKLVNHRTHQIPIDIEDTQLLARSLTNHTNSWDCRTGLKDLMGSHYDPKWTEIDTYDIQDYKNEAFLRYCAIDGAATFKLWSILQEHIDD